MNVLNFSEIMNFKVSCDSNVNSKASFGLIFFSYRLSPDLELKTWNFCNPDFWIASLLFGVIEKVRRELAGK